MKVHLEAQNQGELYRVDHNPGGKYLSLGAADGLIIRLSLASSIKANRLTNRSSTAFKQRVTLGFSRNNASNRSIASGYILFIARGFLDEAIQVTAKPAEVPVVHIIQSS